MLDFLVYVDASFANGDNDSSVIGHYIGLAPSSEAMKIIDGEYTSLAPLSWGTTTTRRVTRSTLAAETYAASEGAETAEWMRAVWLEVLQGVIPTDIVPSTAGSQSTRIRVLTDSASLAATMSSKRQDLASHDKRARIAIKHLQQMLEDPGEQMDLQWISTHAQLADPFTKVMNPALLREAVRLSDARALVTQLKESRAKSRRKQTDGGQDKNVLLSCCLATAIGTASMTMLRMNSKSKRSPVEQEFEDCQDTTNEVQGYYSGSSRNHVSRHQHGSDEIFSALPVGAISTLLHCDRCGADMQKRKPRLRGGWFMGCTRFPVCRHVVAPRDVHQIASRLKEA
eukprot:6480159-Amphidinium_carterae.1